MEKSPYIRIRSLLATFLVIASASLAIAEVKPELTPPLGVDALVKNLDSHAGKPARIYGIVQLVSVERRMFSMIDTSEAQCTDACSPNIVLVRLPENNTALKLPERGHEILVSGMIDAAKTPVELVANEIVDSPK